MMSLFRFFFFDIFFSQTVHHPYQAFTSGAFGMSINIKPFPRYRMFNIREICRPTCYNQ